MGRQVNQDAIVGCRPSFSIWLSVMIPLPRCFRKERPTRSSKGEQTRPTRMLSAFVPYEWPGCVQKRAESISARYRASDGDLALRGCNQYEIFDSPSDTSTAEVRWVLQRPDGP